MKKFSFFFIFAAFVTLLPAQQKTENTAIPASGSSLLKGTLFAPAGTIITLQNNGKNDLIVSMPKEPGKVILQAWALVVFVRNNVSQYFNAIN